MSVALQKHVKTCDQCALAGGDSDENQFLPLRVQSQGIPDVILSKGCVLTVRAIIQTPCAYQHFHDFMVLHGFFCRYHSNDFSAP